MGLFNLVGKIKIEGAEQARSALDGVHGSTTRLADSLHTRLGGAVKSVSSHMADAAGKAALLATALTGMIGAAAFQSAARMDSLVRALAGVSSNAQDLQAQLTRLKEVAKLPGLGFEEAVAGSVALQSAGYSANLAERSLMAFGNALAGAGKGKAELDGVSLALQQIASKGKISAEEINQLRERVPQVGEAMKRAFGTADTEAIGKTGIGAVQFVGKLVSELEKLPKVSGGIQNSIENLSDSIKSALIPLGQGLADMFMGASGSTDSLISKLSGLGKMIGEVFSAIGRSGVLDEVFSSIQKRFSNVFKGDGLQQGIARFAGVALSILKNLPDTIQEIGKYISELFTAIGQNLVKIGGFVLDSLKSITAGIGEFLRGMGGGGGGDNKQKGGMMTGAFGLLEILKLFTTPGMIKSLKDGAERLGSATGSGAISMPTLSNLTALPALSGAFQTNPLADADRFTAQILKSMKPFSMIPEGLIYGGGGKGLEGSGGDSVFAAWDKHLAEIEKNTKSTADALDPRRVFGGGDLAKIGVTAAERSRMSPDPYTRSVDSTLQNAIRRAVRADQRQTSRTMPLYGR